MSPLNALCDVVVELEALVALVALVAVEALPFNVAVIVPALKLPEASRATMVLPVFAFVAFDVTVKVALPDWLAVNVCEPDKPVPDTFIVSVPLPTNAGVFVTVIDVAEMFVIWALAPRN